MVSLSDKMLPSRLPSLNSGALCFSLCCWPTRGSNSGIFSIARCGFVWLTSLCTAAEFGCAPCGGGRGTQRSHWLWRANKVWQENICEDLSEVGINSDHKCTSPYSYQFLLKKCHTNSWMWTVVNCQNKSLSFNSPSMTHWIYYLVYV